MLYRLGGNSLWVWVLSAITGLSVGLDELKEFTSPRAQNVYSCGENDLGDLIAFNGTNCPHAPCEILLGSKVNCNYEIALNDDHDALDVVLTSIFPGIEGPPISYDGCRILVEGQECPLKKGQKYTFSVEVDSTNYTQFVSPGTSFKCAATFSDKITKQSLCATHNAKFV